MSLVKLAAIVKILKIYIDVFSVFRCSSTRQYHHNLVYYSFAS